MSPLGMVIDSSTVPMLVRDDERLIRVSSCARAGTFLASCSCTAIMLYA